MRIWIFIVTAGVLALLAGLAPRVPQDPAYHLFADTRALFGVPNFWDVTSNLSFLAAAALGWRRWREPSFAVFLLGVALTAFGSAYYHLEPTTERLFWDRLPMTIAFMGLLTYFIEERITHKRAYVLLAVLVLLGLASVYYWRMTEVEGRGDLRPYAFIQFGAILLSLLIFVLFPGRSPSAKSWRTLFAAYIVAKIAEVFDARVFELSGEWISGHTLKHLFAGLGCAAFIWWNRDPVKAQTRP